MLFNRLPIVIFDSKYWNGFEGCLNLVKGNPLFSDEEIADANITISKYEGKNVQAAYNNMLKSLKDVKKQPVITTLLIYCGIYSTYYSLDEEITPYQFISWARDRDSIIVPEDMIYWYERKRERVPSTQLSRAKKRIEELEEQYETALKNIKDLKRALAEAQAKLAEAKTQTTTPQEVVTVNTALWEDSCEAACIVIEQIAKNQERGIIKNDFLNRMRAASSKKKTCSGADKTAWKAFPDEYKNGPGFPKKVTVKKHELE